MDLLLDYLSTEKSFEANSKENKAENKEKNFLRDVHKLR